jgi:hypothetical protein
LDDDNMTLLQNLSGQFPLKGSAPQPGPHSKSEKSESKVSMQNDEKFTEAMNAFLVNPVQKLIKNQNDNLHPNKKFRKFLDDDNSTSLPNLSGLSSVKRREPQPGPHSKSEISEV